MKPLPPPQVPDTERFIYINDHRTLLRYFQAIEHKFRYANNFGVAISDDDKSASGDKAVYLRELFVTPKLSTRYRLPEQVIQAELDGQKDADVELVQAIQPHPRLCILGDPGTGKSTLINWLMLALSYSGQNLTKMALGELVPFVMVLRELPFDGFKNWPELWALFLKHNQKELTACFNDDPDVIEPLFTSGQALILLDGLDEITHSGQRQALADALNQAMREYPRCRFIVTTRVIGFNQAEWFGLAAPGNESDLKTALKLNRPDIPQPLTEQYLSPFSYEQVRRFIENWYKQYIPNAENHRQKIDDLLERLNRNDGLGRLARIPVLLNMICFIHARRGRLPDGRAELYQRIAETYLVSLDKARGIKLQGQDLNFDYHDLCLWLGNIAWQLQLRRTEEDGSILMCESEVKTVLLDGLQEHGFSEPESQSHADYILEYLSQRSGLFIPRGVVEGEEHYAFSHLSFLEYFAACHLEQNVPFYKASDWKILRKNTQKAWWHETLALFFECQTNPRLTEKYLSSLFPKPPTGQIDWGHILLADIVLDSSVRLPSATRSKVIKELWQLLSVEQELFDFGVTELTTRLWQNPFMPMPPDPIKVQMLDFSTLAITDLGQLTEFQNLQGLSLDNTAISDIQPLAGLQNLQSLSLEKTAVSDLQPLAGLRNLQWLSLQKTAISDLQPLAGLQNLQWLLLFNTNVSQEQIDYLQQHLSQLQVYK